MTLILHGIPINSNDYFGISEKITGLQKRVSGYFNINYAQLRWHHYERYAEEVLDYVITKHDFGPIASKAIYGRARKIDGVVSILLNTNISQNIGRVRFTLLHEIAHGYGHLGCHNGDRILLHSPTKNPSETLAEVEADIWASNMLISDDAIFSVMENNMTFYQMRTEFGCTGAALFTRLKSFLHFNLDLPVRESEKLVRDFENYGDNLIKEVINNFFLAEIGISSSGALDGIGAEAGPYLYTLIFEALEMLMPNLSNKALEFCATMLYLKRLELLELGGY